jgi:hypothetical protein
VGSLRSKMRQTSCEEQRLTLFVRAQVAIGYSGARAREGIDGEMFLAFGEGLRFVSLFLKPM